MPQEGINFESVPLMNDRPSHKNRYVGSVTPVNLRSQQGNMDRDHIRLDDCNRELVEMTEKFNRVIWKELMMKSQEAFPDSYIWTKTFKIKGMKDIKQDLHRIVKNMVEAGFWTECCNMYNIFRSNFLNKCLCRLGLHEIKLCDVNDNHIENLINAFHIALSILLPIETFFLVSLSNVTFFPLWSSGEWRLNYGLNLWCWRLVTIM